MLKRKSFTVLVSALMVFFATTLGAQTVTPSQEEGDQDQETKITDAQLKKFIKVSNDLTEIQQEQRAKQKSIIKDNGMTMKRYREISRAKHSNKEVEMSKKEQKKFSKIQKEMRAFQKKRNKKAEEILKKHSLSPKKFMQIRRKLQSDKELQKRFRSMRKQGQQGQ